MVVLMIFSLVGMCGLPLILRAQPDGGIGQMTASGPDQPLIRRADDLTRHHPAGQRQAEAGLKPPLFREIKIL
jgi:hypothetical protein